MLWRFLLTLLFLPSFVWAQETVLQNNTLVTDLADFRNGARLYRIDLPGSTKELRIQTTGPAGGNVDLYVRWGTPPSVFTYDFLSVNAGNAESVIVPNPRLGSWYIMLFARDSYNGVTLNVLYSGSTAQVPIGQVAWAFDAGVHIYSAPAVALDGTIYAAGTSSTHGPSLYALNADGSFKDVMRSNFELYASPVIARDGTMYITGEDPFDSKVGRLKAVAPFKTTKWEFPRDVQPRHPVAVAKDGTAYIASDINSLLAITPAGGLKWEFFAAPQMVGSAPAVIATNGFIYSAFYNIGLARGKIYAVHPAGTNVWQTDVVGAVKALSLDGTGGVLFGMADGNSAVYALDSTGKQRWRADLRHQAYVISAPVLAPDGTIFVTTSRKLVALRNTGAEKWQHTSEETLFETEFPTAPVVDANGTIYYGTAGSSGNGWFYAVNANGQQLWKRQIPSSVRSPITLTSGGNLIFGGPDGAGRLIAIRAGAALAASVWPVVRQNISNTGAVPPPPVGAVQVTVSPNEAITAGAQWQVDGGSFQANGATVSNLGVGSHTISFKGIPGWRTPANLSVTVLEDQTATVTGQYIPGTGWLKVNITPPEAITAGALWQVNGSAFLTNGAVQELSLGQHLVAFKPVAGWVTPPNQVITITQDQVTTISGAYAKSVGSLAVFLGPEAALQAGGQWRMDNGVFRNAGTVEGISVGNHLIEFKPVAGWLRPPPQLITINQGQTTVVAASYQEFPKVSVFTLPDKRIVARFPTVAGYNYTLQTATTLGQPTFWGDVQTFAGTGSTMEVVLKSSASGFQVMRVSPTVFYRLKIQ